MTEQAHIGIYVTVFVAVVSAVLALLGNVLDAARSSAERLEAGSGLDIATDVVETQVTQFISRGRLFSLRLTFALIPAVVVLAALLLAGIKSVAALVAVPLVLSVVGSFLPVLFYHAKLRKRKEQFEEAILDLVVGIGNAMKAGMALPQALEKVGNQMKGVMREELLVVMREYRLGLDLVRALDRMSRRMPCEDMRLLVCAIRLTTEAGGSLASVLAEMTAMIRGRREFADKVKALTAEGRFEAIAMSCAPLVAFCFLHLIHGEMMRPLYTTGVGWLTLGGVVLLEVSGYFVIRKIVSIEV